MSQTHRRLRSSLHIPDDAAWHRLPHYSVDLGRALMVAYGALHNPAHPDRYFASYCVLIPFRERLLCAEQRLRLEYALALAYAGENAVPQSLDSIAHAQEIAVSVLDWPSLAELNFMAGVLLASLGLHAEAYTAYYDALVALRRLERNGVPLDPTFELDLVIRLGWRAWELGWFPVCLRHLDEAYALRARWAPEPAQQAAYLAWLDAQLSRVRGRPLHALQQITAAADLLVLHGPPIDVGRSQTMLAESALEVVEDESIWGQVRRSALNLQTDTGALLRAGPKAILGRARTAAQLAAEKARQAEDPIGVTMAQLASRRAARLRNPRTGGEGSMHTVERLLRTAHRLGDVSLQGRAETAIGDELLADGRPRAALEVYRKAIHLLEEHELGGLAIWPRRAAQALSADSP